MALKRKAEYKRDDYAYCSPDGEEYEITVIQTADSKYVEVKREEDSVQVRWDVEMLLDIADAVRSATQKSAAPKTHTLKKPQVVDRRKDNSDELQSPSESIQESVEESMKSLSSADSTSAVESFSPGGKVAGEIQDRISRPIHDTPVEAKIKRKDGVSAGDLF